MKAESAALKSLTEWNHINCLFPAAIEMVQDDILSQLVALNFEGEDEDGGGVEDGEDCSGQARVSREKLHDGAVTFLFEKRSESLSETSS